MKKQITIPREVYEHALALEKEKFIVRYCCRMETNGYSDREAELYLMSRAIEFPLILQKYGTGALNRTNFYRWSKLASDGKNPDDSCNINNRLCRLSGGKAGLKFFN